MGKRGPKPKKLISETWRPALAYAIGLLASDGCLSPPGHLIDLTSAEREQLKNFIACLDTPLTIAAKRGSTSRRYWRVQFKNVFFYDFLLSIGLTPAKSKTIGPLKVPDEFFWDFLRGVFDGDGSTYSYWDPRWRSSFMYYVCFASASKKFAEWLRASIRRLDGARGHVTASRRSNDSVLYQLKYAKADGLRVLRRMYARRSGAVYLRRKRLKIDRMLSILDQSL